MLCISVFIVICEHYAKLESEVLLKALESRSLGEPYEVFCTCLFWQKSSGTPGVSGFTH